MENENQGKAIQQRAKPTVIEIGSRKQISTGRWNDELVADYVLDKGQNRWIRVGELSRFAYGNGSIRMKQRARQCLAKLFRFLLIERGAIMITEVEDHRRVISVKIYNSTLEEDRQRFKAKFDRLQSQYNLTTVQLDKVRDLAGELWAADAPMAEMHGDSRSQHGQTEE